MLGNWLFRRASQSCALGIEDVTFRTKTATRPGEPPTPIIDQVGAVRWALRYAERRRTYAGQERGLRAALETLLQLETHA